MLGTIIGRLKVVKLIKQDKKKNKYWECVCSCGKTCIVRQDHLKTGRIKSCGCLNQELASARMKNNKISVTHGLSKTRLYHIWQAMKRRCYDKNNRRYEYYGGKGIVVCDEWKNDFLNFYNWAIKNGYQSSLTIDRINVNLEYCPKNCRWASYEIQNNNTSRNHFVFYKGERLTIAQCARKYNIPQSTLWYRVKQGHF